MCEALGIGGYNKVYAAAELAHMRILSSIYVELHAPAQFPERSTEDPLNIMLKYKKIERKEKTYDPRVFLRLR